MATSTRFDCPGRKWQISLNPNLCCFAVAINDLANDKVFLYNVSDVGDTNINAGEVALIGTITMGVADTVFAVANATGTYTQV